MKFFDKLADIVVKGRWYFFAFFILAVIASVCMMPFIGVNYDMTKYLPEDSQTRIALEVMGEEFGSNGSANIVVQNTTPERVAEIATMAQNIEGVSSAIFYNNAEYYNTTTHAGLIKIFFDSGDYDTLTESAINELRSLCDSLNVDSAFSGESVNAVASRNAISTEVWVMMVVAIAIMLIILTLTSLSWIEPLVYLIVIGASVIINIGTNLVMGSVSFFTQSISAIMLIAIIMDYCIVLCTRYREESTKGGTPKEAMTRALASSFNTVLACSLTVLVGLIALCFMDFRIGFDLGIVLAKGVVISILAVLFFMPSIILLFNKPMQKLEHKSFLPRLNKLGTFADKTKWVMPVIMVGLIITGICLQQNITFSYIVDNSTPGSQMAKEQAIVEESFGTQNSLVILLPKGNYEAESQLVIDLTTLEVNGECYIQSPSGFVTTGLTQKLTATEIENTFKIDTTSVAKLYNYIDPTLDHTTDSVYLFQILETIHAHPDVVTDMFSAKQATLNTLYTQIDNTVVVEGVSPYTVMPYTYAMAKFGGDEALFRAVYAGALGKNPAAITEADVLPAYVVMQGVATATQADPSAYPEIKEKLTTLGFLPLTKEQVLAQGLPAEIVDTIFSSYNATDNILLLQLMQAMCSKDAQQKTILDNLAAEVLGSIEQNYTDEQSAKAMFLSENYSRLIFNINAGIEDQNAIDTIAKVHELMAANTAYTEYYLVNPTQNLTDTIDVFSSDRMRTDLITILGVFFIVMLLMRSVSIPVLLVLLIQGAIWISLAVGTFFGEEIYFVCYLLGMVLQMGATIDYAILLTDRYVFFRKSQPKLDAIKSALNSSFPTIITSSSILVVACFSIHFISSMPVLQSVGGLIGRGALISFVVVMFVLPQILLLFDKIISKTTIKSNFVNDKKNLIIVEPDQVAPKSDKK